VINTIKVDLFCNLTLFNSISLISRSSGKCDVQCWKQKETLHAELYIYLKRKLDVSFTRNGWENPCSWTKRKLISIQHNNSGFAMTTRTILHLFSAVKHTITKN